MKPSRPLLSLPSLLLATALGTAFALAGCGSTGAAQPPVAASAGDLAEPDHEVAGFPPAAVLDSLSLRPEQRAAVQAIRDDVHRATQPVRDARKALFEALAAGLEAGSLDPATVAPQVEALGQATEASKGAVQDGMNRLHAALDPGQRKELVDAVKSRAHHGWHGGASDGQGPRQQMQKLADELKLSGDQRDAIKKEIWREWKEERHASRAKRGETWHQMRAVGEAFPQEAFDARALDVGKNAPDLARYWGIRAARLTAAAAPVLTPAQRAELAQKLRERAARP